MSRKLRIFISSTMRDLANERDAVCRRLISFNFEPVNAGGWVTTGTKIWPRIHQEIESCDVFVLIVGERYGWIPTKGDQANLGMSVTHLEYKAARDLSMPILPFLKRLDFNTDRESEDAKKRDQFREEVSKWEQGQYITEFELASDLADKVGHSLVALLTDDFLGRTIRDRVPQADHTFRLLEPHPDPALQKHPVEISRSLLEVVKNRRAVLFAGAGISLPAGLPSAAVFSEHLAQVLFAADPSYGVSPVGSAFAAIASDVEASTSRDYLVREVAKILNPPQGLQPTIAHKSAVQLFDVIITTNWDGLFEEAATSQGLDFPVITKEIGDALPDRAIIKLHGSVSETASLLLTEADILSMDKTRPRLWESARFLIANRPLVVIGTSLRDPSIVRLFTEARSEIPGFYVVPKFFHATAERLRAWNLECIAADAESFLTSLADFTNQ
jgi:Domain of unknown function (DUF4062)/SIR2-like domain